MKLILHPASQDHLMSLISKAGGSVLLHGSAGVGKRSFAVEAARQLNCLGCTDGSCASCRQIAGGNHPNLLQIDPDDKQKIGIEAVQQLAHDLQYAQYQAGQRVVIISRAETMTIPAANALLKTLEEPPADTLIILTATSPAALMDTITSRCRPIYIPKPNESDLHQYLTTDCHVDEAAAGELVQISDGLPGVAIKLAKDEDAWKQRRSAFELAQDFAGQGLFGRMQLLARIGKDPQMADLLLQSLTRLIRERGREGTVPASAVQPVLNARQYIKANIAPKTALEALAVQLP